MPVLTAPLRDLPISHFEATPAGEQWLSGQPEFLELAAAFVTTDVGGRTNPEDVFKQTPLIGMGNHSEVHEVGGVAVKLSTPTTGRAHWKSGDTSVEDLPNQFRYLESLGDWFFHHNEYDITVPEQFLAMRAGRRHLRVEQYMAGWDNLYSVIKDRRIGRDDEHDINQAVKARIAAAVGHPLLRFGLHDMGLERGEYLHSRNVLVPSGAGEDLTHARLCIIDQPSTGLRGRLAVAALRLGMPVRHQTHAHQLEGRPVPL